MNVLALSAPVLAPRNRFAFSASLLLALLDGDADTAASLKALREVKDHLDALETALIEDGAA